MITRYILSNTLFQNSAKFIFYSTFILSLFYFVFNPKDYFALFGFIILFSVLLIKIKIHRFREISFDSEFFYVGKEKINFSTIQEIKISYLKPSVVVYNSKKIFFSISLEEYSKQEKIKILKKYLPDNIIKFE